MKRVSTVVLSNGRSGYVYHDDDLVIGQDLVIFVNRYGFIDFFTGKLLRIESTEENLEYVV